MASKNTTGSAALNRRNVVMGVAAAAALVPTGLPATRVLLDLDADLIALLKRADALRTELVAADEAEDQALKRYWELAPNWPEALHWSPMSLVMPRNIGHTTVIQDGKRLYVCNPDDIEELRGKRPMKKIFIGTEEDSDRLWNEGRIPEQVAEFTREVPDTEEQARIGAFLAVYDAFKAEDQAAHDRSGLTAAEKHTAAIHDQMYEAYEASAETRAQTAGGIKAKAALLKAWDEDDYEGSMQRAMVTSIVDDVLALSVTEEA